MTAQATLLYRLQQFDLVLAKHRARLKQIETTLGQDERVQASRAVLSSAEGKLNAQQTHARDLDLEIKSLVEKIKATEDRLYGGAVHNPKELQDLQEEAVSLKKRQNKLEEDNIEALLLVEQEQASVGSAKSGLDAALSAFAGTQSDLIAEKNRLDVEVENYEKRRKAAAAEIDPASLSRYEALRPKKRGLAVSLFKDGSCVTCGVEQTSMIAQQVKGGHQLVLCANCGRILALPNG